MVKGLIQPVVVQCIFSVKAKFHYTSFPVASPLQVGNCPAVLLTSPQHKQQVCNKLALAKVRCVCCVVSFPKFYYNDLLPTSPCMGKLRGNVCNGFWAQACKYWLNSSLIFMSIIKELVCVYNCIDLLVILKLFWRNISDP